MLELFTKTGFLGYPLLLCSIASVAIIFWRISQWSILQMIPEADIKALLQPSDKACCPTAQLSHPGLRSLVDVLWKNKALEKSARDELATVMLESVTRSYHTGVRSLRIIAVISPMVGLLGTVIGMISAFAVIAETDVPVTPALLADGLWVAMLTTAFGLIVALPALFAAHIFCRRADTCIAELAHYANAYSLQLQGAELPHDFQ